MTRVLRLSDEDIATLTYTWVLICDPNKLTPDEAEAWERFWDQLFAAGQEIVNSADTETPMISSLADLV